MLGVEVVINGMVGACGLKNTWSQFTEQCSAMYVGLRMGKVNEGWSLGAPDLE